MSTLKIFAVHDSKAEAFMTPFFQLTTGLAIRSFQAAVNEEGHEFQKYASDYTLFEVGEFDSSSGEVTTLPTPQSLGLALQFIHNVPAVPELELTKLGVIAGGD